MPCGGVYPLTQPDDSPCLRCGRRGGDHWVEEWDGAVHRGCLLDYLGSDEGEIILDHGHPIIIGLANGTLLELERLEKGENL